MAMSSRVCCLLKVNNKKKTTRGNGFSLYKYGHTQTKRRKKQVSGVEIK
jgi:hypothetical protein